MKKFDCITANSLLAEGSLSCGLTTDLVKIPRLPHTSTCQTQVTQWRSEGPAGPATAGGGGRGAEGAHQGPPGRSSRCNPLAGGPDKLLAGGAENRRYATEFTSVTVADDFDRWRHIKASRAFNWITRNNPV